MLTPIGNCNARSDGEEPHCTLQPRGVGARENKCQVARMRGMRHKEKETCRKCVSL